MTNTPFWQKTIEPFKFSLDQHRQKMLSIVAKFPCADGVIFFEEYITINPNYQQAIWIFRPEGFKKTTYPTLFYLPGTAFIAKETAVTKMLCTHIAKASQCQVIVIYAELAPHYPFPKSLYQVIDALQVILSKPYELNIDIDRIMLTGYSSGANFVAQIAAILRVTWLFHVLASPIVDLSRSLTTFPQYQQYESYEQKDKCISESFVYWFLSFYIPKPIDLCHPLLSPYYQALPKNFAPTYLIYGENDRFRSDAEAYIQKLEDACLPVCAIMFKNSDHSLVWIDYDFIKIVVMIIKKHVYPY